MTDVERTPRWSTRIVLVLGILAGLNSSILLATSQPEQVSLASDVYYHAASAALEGGDVYEVTPPSLPGYHYIYPPVVVLAFVPHALLGSQAAAYALQTVLNAAATIGIGVVLVRALGRRGIRLGRGDRLLLVAFAALSAWSANQFVMGQVNLLLALAFALGFDWLDRDGEGLATGSSDRSPDGGGLDPGRRSDGGVPASDDSVDDTDTVASVVRRRSPDLETAAGAAFALAALVKLFPATIGLWLLRTRRYRAVGAAIATGLGGLVLGVLVFGPDLTVQYLTEVLVDRFHGETFEGTPDPERNHTTVRRMLAAAFGGSSPLVTPVALALVLPPVAYCYRDVSTDARRLATALATIVGTLLVMPLQPLYFSLLYFPAVVLLFVLPSGRPRLLLVGGTVLTSTFVGPQTAEWFARPLPARLGEALVDATNATFTVVLPPTVGMWLLLGACVGVHAHRGR